MAVRFARFGKVLLAPVAAFALASGSYAVATHGIASSDPSVVPTPTGSASGAADPSPSASPSPSVAPFPSPTVAAQDTVARFHGDATHPCPFPPGSTLTGNWNHGAYVAAWAATGDHAATHQAAKSDCGKPVSSMHSEDHGRSAEAADHADDVDDDEADEVEHEDENDHPDHGDQGHHGEDDEAQNS